MRTIRAALRRGAAQLDRAGIENSRQEARRLLAYALGIPIEALLRDPDATIDPGVYTSVLARRTAHEPLAFITGHREFWSLDFAVSGATLIPRADSETLIEAALAALPDRTQVRRVLISAPARAACCSRCCVNIRRHSASALTGRPRRACSPEAMLPCLAWMTGRQWSALTGPARSPARSS